MRIESVYEKALFYLSFRPRSEQEMRRYLHDKGLDEERGEQILGRLKRAHLVDDQDFARFWVESREDIVLEGGGRCAPSSGDGVPREIRPRTGQSPGHQPGGPLLSLSRTCSPHSSSRPLSCK